MYLIIFFSAPGLFVLLSYSVFFIDGLFLFPLIHHFITVYFFHYYSIVIFYSLLWKDSNGTYVNLNVDTLSDILTM